MKNFNFYGVIGKNGVAVFNFWAGVKRSEPYLRKITYHGFDTFQEAEDWAIGMFEDRHPSESGNILRLQLNRPVFFSRLRSERGNFNELH